MQLQQYKHTLQTTDSSLIKTAINFLFSLFPLHSSKHSLPRICKMEREEEEEEKEEEEVEEKVVWT